MYFLEYFIIFLPLTLILFNILVANYLYFTIIKHVNLIKVLYFVQSNLSLQLIPIDLLVHAIIDFIKESISKFSWFPTILTFAIMTLRILLVVNRPLPY